MEPAPNVAPHTGTPGAEDVQFCHSFKVAGKVYTLFKRSRTKDAPYYLHLQVKGKRVKRSLETNVAKVAADRARKIIAMARGERWDEVDEQRARLANGTGTTLGAVLEVYGQDKTQNPKTMVGVESAWRSICHRVLPDRVMEDVMLREVQGEWARRYKEALEAEYQAEPVAAVMDPEQRRKAALQRAARTGQSTVNKARSLFTPERMERYRAASLVVPKGMLDFCAATRGLFHQVRRKEQVYVRPSDEVIKATFTAADKLKETDFNAYLAFWMALGCGLRKAELSAAKWEWVVEKEGKGYIHSDYLAKGGEMLEVPILDDAWQRLAPHRKAEGYVIEGHKTERIEDVFRRIGAWMAGLGWDTEKKLHELRKFVGSKIAEQHGVVAAALYLRHSNVGVTERYYMRYLKMRRLEVKLF